MADEVRRFAVTVPAGTPIAAPAVFDLSFPPREVAQISVRIPRGVNGVVGLWIGAAGTQVIPQVRGTWITGDDDRLDYPTANLHNSGSWQMTAYNTGAYPHLIGVTFLLDIPGLTPAPSPPAIPLASLQPS